MNRANFLTSAARWALLFGLAAAPLAACSRSAQPDQAPSPLAALPLSDSSTAPIAPAPPVSALPPAPPLPVRHLANRQDGYAFADRAYALNDAFGDAPPDYGFDYGGTQPWVWRSDDNAMRVAEPLPGGGDRYYYYEPGADYPYLVRDPEYAYGFEDGQLVVIYDHEGRTLPDNDYETRRDYASRFFARGRGLYAQSQQQQQRQAVAQAIWAQRRDRYAAEQQSWANAQANDSDWRDYHAAHDQDQSAQWAAERVRREAEAARFAQSVNDQQTASRDWQAARDAQAHAPAPAPFGVHLGGGAPSSFRPPQTSNQPAVQQGLPTPAPGSDGSPGAGPRHDHGQNGAFGNPGVPGREGAAPAASGSTIAFARRRRGRSA